MPRLLKIETFTRDFDTLDFSQCPALDSLIFESSFTSDTIEFLNLKNGKDGLSYFVHDFNLKYSKIF
ncbi:MAG: hypothetical protein IPO92_04690 [Saprospiraceae bacterium]|nr:hypothetical protein [Saprospiraceae bacterium]